MIGSPVAHATEIPANTRRSHLSVVQSSSQTVAFASEQKARVAAKQKVTEIPHIPVPVLQPNVPVKNNKSSKLKRITPRYQRQIQLEEEDTNSFLNIHPKRKILKPKNLNYDPKIYFQGFLQKAYRLAKMNNCDVRLDNLKAHPIILVFKTRELYFEYGEDNLYASFTEEISEKKPIISVLKSDKNLSLPCSGSHHSIESFLWKLAIRTSRGRVPVGTKLSNPVFLHRWPNMTRFQLIPSGFRIAALWTNNPQPLSATAKTLNIPYEYVFAFYSAAKSIGLIGHFNTEYSSVPTSATISKHRYRNVFKRILTRLRGN